MLALDRTSAPPVADAHPLGDPLPHVRRAVRDILLATPAYQEADPVKRQQLAQAMVKVCHVAATLIREEVESDAEAQRTLARAQGRAPVAVAQSAGSEFSGVAAERVADTTRRILNAVSFPRFVAELINGVFKAMLDSTAQQMNSYVELLNNVSASLEGFDEANYDHDSARTWLAEKFPGSYEVTSAESDDGQAGRRLQMREGANRPPDEALRTGLGLDPTDPVPGGDPEQLVAFARRQMARQRQQMLATMVMLGMQRIVIESGRITAAMRFHIDTRSAAQADQGSTFDLRNELDVKAGFKIGAWGVDASMKNTIGYVSTQRSQTTEEMNTDLDLNSTVEINFKSDYLPLNRLTTPSQAARIQANTINPAAEDAARAERERRIAATDKARGESLDSILTPPAPTPATTPAPRSTAAPTPAPTTEPTPATTPAPRSTAAPTTRPASTPTPAPARTAAISQGVAGAQSQAQVARPKLRVGNVRVLSQNDYPLAVVDPTRSTIVRTQDRPAIIEVQFAAAPLAYASVVDQKTFIVERAGSGIVAGHIQNRPNNTVRWSPVTQAGDILQAGHYRVWIAGDGQMAIHSQARLELGDSLSDSQPSAGGLAEGDYVFDFQVSAA
jgi:hypothetical protein